jgi:hypothetical protein
MTNDGYRFLASALLERFADVKLCRKVKNKPTAAAAAQKRPDMAAKKESWVGENDSSVHRRYDLESGNEGRGGRGQRGGG